MFLWTFSIPSVVQGAAKDLTNATILVFFLTYGFIGLEVVATKLMFPFDDGSHDLGLTGMREATFRGIESDILLVEEPIDFL
jgi:predicted membrane chloride channel (bestrophin family)